MGRKPLAGLIALASLALAPGAAAATGLRPISPSSPNVERSTDVYYLMLVFAGVIFLLVVVPLVLFIVRFRSGGRDRSVEGPQIRGNTNLELAWTVAPVLILATIGTFVFYKLPGIVDLTRVGQRELVVRVEGRQFYWQYEYPNGVVAINTLRVPVGEVVELEITAPNGDVNHSFWVPPLGGKFDAIPGRTVKTQFQAERAGSYEGQCAEFCGIQHAAMLATIEAVPRDEFQRWLAAQQRAQARGTSDLGVQEWKGVCSTCHDVDALGNRVAGKIGPQLAGNPILNQPEAVEQVARNGRGAMPGVARGWSDRQMKALLRYLQRNVAKQGGQDGG